MELGRECLDIWGYRRVDELIWVKVNQLQRLIRTGRTGHWLNHSKEHCLVGVKGNPHINRNVDCDVVVGEVKLDVTSRPAEPFEFIIMSGQPAALLGIYDDSVFSTQCTFFLRGVCLDTLLR